MKLKKWTHLCLDGLARHTWDRFKSLDIRELGFRNHPGINSLQLPACKCGAVKLNGRAFIPQAKSIAKI